MVPVYVFLVQDLCAKYETLAIELGVCFWLVSTNFRHPSQTPLQPSNLLFDEATSPSHILYKPTVINNRRFDASKNHYLDYASSQYRETL